MLQIRKILFQVSDFTRYVTERSRDVRVNPLTRGISINLSSVSMASHISPTAVHVDSPDPIHIAFKEPKNSSLKTRSLFSTVRRIMVSWGGGAYMHLCAEGGGWEGASARLCNMRWPWELGSGAFTSPGGYFRDSSKMPAWTQRCLRQVTKPLHYHCIA